MSALYMAKMLSMYKVDGQFFQANSEQLSGYTARPKMTCPKLC